MTPDAAVELFRNALLDCLDETFEHVRGMYLDRGTSLLETLEGLSAEDASRPPGSGCATVAAHVEHVRFYLDVLDEVMRTEVIPTVDWRTIWATVHAVTPDEWAEQRKSLRASYARVLATITSYDRWHGEHGMRGAFALVAHTAYHLGAIRQATCSIRLARPLADEGRPA